MITLIPFPLEELPLAWEWMNEFPAANIDDYGPKTYEEFKEQIIQRMRSEVICGVKYKGKLVGIIGYIPLNARYGMFHGICFSKAVHGKHICSEAVRTFIAKLFATGVDKISASYFAQNRRIRRFLKSLGAVDEGYLRKQTVQNGKYVDAILVAIFRETSCP